MFSRRWLDLAAPLKCCINGCREKQHDVSVAHVATLPVLTADQAQTIKALLKETER